MNITKYLSGKAVRRIFAVAVATLAIVWISGLRVFAFSGDSMLPSVMSGDRFIGKVGLWGEQFPDRFQMVIFDLPPHSPWVERKIPWMKRLIGLPGEHVRLSGNRLFIDGQPVEAPSLHLDDPAKSPQTHELVLDNDEYFVVGDNLDHSLEDSRTFGPLKRSLLKGTVVYVISGARKKQ